MAVLEQDKIRAKFVVTNKNIRNQERENFNKLEIKFPQLPHKQDRV